MITAGNTITGGWMGYRQITGQRARDENHRTDKTQDRPSKTALRAKRSTNSGDQPRSRPRPGRSAGGPLGAQPKQEWLVTC